MKRLKKKIHGIDHSLEKRDIPPAKENGLKNKETKSGSSGGIKKYALIGAIVAVVLILLYILLGPTIRHANLKRKLAKLNVILITLDTLRQDFVSAYDNAKAETPNLKQVAEEGVLFENCIAQTPLTLPSHTTILSGTYPIHHQVRDNGGFLVPDNLELVSEVLKRNEFRTSAFIASYVLHSKWGLNQGFETYSDSFDLSKYEKISLGNVQKRADEVLNNAKQWLSVHRQERFFTWIHLYDPHVPYEPPSPFKEKYPKRPYRGEVEYVDYQLGLFFKTLKEMGLYDNSLIIITADHGEGLGQHNEQTHGFFVYESTVKVPLIIRAPVGFPVTRVKQVVELVDLAPTILETVNIPIPHSYQGQSLVSRMLGETNGIKTTAYTESYYPRFHFGWSELKALYYDNHWKYIQAPKDELYNMQADPGETDNQVLKQSFLAGKAKEKTERFINTYADNVLKSQEVKNLDREELQKLATLGYFTTKVETKGNTTLPDPKGKVDVFNRLSKAKDYFNHKEYDKSIQLLKQILETDPNLVDGMLQLGNVYIRKNMLEEALEWYNRVLEHKPDYQAAMINVLGTLLRLEHYDKGIEEAQRYLKIFPNDFTLYNELAEFYISKQEFDTALTVLQKSIGIESVNPHAFVKIAGIHIIKNQIQTAEEFLKKAREINQNLKRLYYHLAQVEENNGNIPQAIAYYKKELENYPQDFKSTYNLAEDLRKTGQSQEALDYYQKTIENNPRFNIPYFMIAKQFVDSREKIDEAVELCQKGITLHPQDKYTVLGYYILADIYSLKGDTNNSGKFFQKGEELIQQLKSRNLW